MSKYKRLGFISLYVVLILLMIVPISANVKNGSINIYYHGNNQKNETIELSNVPFGIYSFARDDGSGLVVNKEYSELNIDIENIDSSSNREYANKIYQYISDNNIIGNIKYTNDNARCNFSDLPQGIYLVAQLEKSQYEDGSFSSLPFLISMPMSNNGYSIYDVNVEPKGEWTIETGITKPENNVKAVDTGDEQSYYKYVTLIAITSTLLCFQKKKTRCNKFNIFA